MAERSDNYEWVVQSIRRLRNGGTLNEDDTSFYREIRAYCADFTGCNIEVTDAKFRRKAFETEQMARYLQLYLNETGELESTTYVQFLERCRFLFDFFTTPEEITEQFSNIRM